MDPLASGLEPCRTCGEQISTQARTCPRCGAPWPTTAVVAANNERAARQGAWISVAGIAVIGLLGYGYGLYAQLPHDHFDRLYEARAVLSADSVLRHVNEWEEKALSRDGRFYDYFDLHRMAAKRAEELGVPGRQEEIPWAEIKVSADGSSYSATSRGVAADVACTAKRSKESSVSPVRCYRTGFWQLLSWLGVGEITLSAVLETLLEDQRGRLLLYR